MKSSILVNQGQNSCFRSYQVVSKLGGRCFTHETVVINQWQRYPRGKVTKCNIQGVWSVCRNYGDKTGFLDFPISPTVRPNLDTLFDI